VDTAAVQRSHVEAVTHVARAILEDGVVTTQELDALGRIAHVLGVDWASLPPQLAQTLTIAHTVLRIGNGQPPILDPRTTHLNEATDELTHAQVGAQVLDERVIRREYRGGSSGVSLRVCKGVNYRFGSTRGYSVPVTAVVPVDSGTLSITNQRVVFAGRLKSFSIPWAKVASVEPMADGVHLAFTSRTKSALIKYTDPTYAEIYAALLARYAT